MGLKVAIAQAVAGTGTVPFTQDFTDTNAGFSSDVKAAIFIASNAATNHSATDGMRLQFSIAANNGKCATLSMAVPDAATTTTFYGRYSNEVSTDQDAYAWTIAAGGSQAEFDIDSWLSNGVRVEWNDTTRTERELISCLLIGGDVEASVVHATFSASNTATVAHGLTGTPEVLVFLFMNASAASQNASPPSIGFWTSSGAASAGFRGSFDATDKARAGSYLTTTYVAEECHATTGVLTGTGGISVSNVDSDSVDLACTTTASKVVSILCLRGTSTAITAKAGIYDTEVATGSAGMGLSLAVNPQVLLSIPTRRTTTGALGGDDAAGCYGLIAAANNAGAGTQYGGIVAQTDVGADPTNAASQSTNSQALRVLDTSHAADLEATISAWSTGDVTLNYSNVAASALKIPYLAFGIASTTSIKYLRLATDPGAVSATGVEGVVFEAPSAGDITGAKIGEFDGAAFESATEGGQAILLVDVTDFGGSALTTASTPVALARNTDSTTGLVSCTVIEE